MSIRYASSLIGRTTRTAVDPVSVDKSQKHCPSWQGRFASVAAHASAGRSANTAAHARHEDKCEGERKTIVGREKSQRNETPSGKPGVWGTGARNEPRGRIGKSVERRTRRRRRRGLWCSTPAPRLYRNRRAGDPRGRRRMPRSGRAAGGYAARLMRVAVRAGYSLGSPGGPCEPRALAPTVNAVLHGRPH